MGEILPLHERREGDLRAEASYFDGIPKKDAETFALADGSQGRLPAMRRFMELPIQVQHAWDSYPLVDQALVQLEQGQFLNAALLADAINTDDRVLGCMSTRINGLFGLPLEFKYPGQEEDHASAKPAAPAQKPGAAPGGPDNSKDGAPTQKVEQEDEDSPESLALKKKITELAEDHWEKMLPGAAQREQMRWGLLLNAGIGELDWDWGRDGLLWPTLKTWNTQFLYWRWDTRSYWLIHQEGQVELHPGDGKWVLFSPTGHNHGWLYGLIRALSKLWLDRMFTMRDWSRASEKFGLGIIKAKAPANASKDDKQRFTLAMQNLASESTILLPQGAKKEDGSFDVEMMETDPAVREEFYKVRMHQLDTSIAVCLLGQNLSTEISGSSGSRAAAQVHDNVRGDFLKADDEIWSSMVRTQVLRPWVEYNWGDIIAAMGRSVDDFVPEVRHKVDPPEDLEKKSKAILAISQAVPGFAGTEADIHALLDEHGIPTVDERSNPDRPPPGADVNERPPPPLGEDHPINEPEPTEPAPKEPIQDPEEAPVEAKDDGLDFASFGRKGWHKPGQRKGRILADELTDGAVKAGADALEARRKALLAIIRGSQSFDEMRARIKKLYWDAKPSQLRSIVEQSMVAAQLLGRAGAKLDRAHDTK